MRSSLLAFILFCSLSASGQAYEYAKLLGSVGGDARGQAVMTGPGGIYTKGVFTGALKIGPAYYRASHSDAFLMKHDDNGNYIWFRKVGFNRVENAVIDGDGAMDNDNANNVLLTGTYTGSTTIEGHALTNLGSGDVYVVKYDQNGNLQWIRSLGGDRNDTGNAVTTDAAGNVYIAGTTRSPNFEFGGSSLPTGIVGGSSTKGAFFAKLNADGTDAWIQFRVTTNEQNEMNALHHEGTTLLAGGKVNRKAFIGRYNDANGTTVWDSDAMGTVQSANSIMRSIVSNNGKLYTAGEFQVGDIQFGALSPMANQGNRDMFFAAFDLNGDPLFSDAYGTAAQDGILAQDFSDYDGDEMVFAAGYYGDPLSIGSSDLPDPAGSTGAVAIRFNVENDTYNSDSEKAVLTGGTGSWLGIAEAGNQMYIAGFYSGAVDMAGDHFNQASTTFMVTKYDYDHNELFSLTSHKGYITAKQLKVDASGFVYLAGEFRGTVDLYGNVIVSSESNANNNDLFIAKLQPDGTVVWVKTVETQDFETMLDMTVDGAGNVYFIAHFFFDPTIAGVLVSPVEAERLLVKLSPIGSYVYSHLIDGTGGDVTSIEGDADGDGVFVAGIFDSEFNFQGYNFGSNGNYDIFLMRLDDEGDVTSPSHIKQFGEGGSDYVTDLHHEAGMNLAMTGYTNGAIDFGNSSVIANADGFNDVYWVRFNSAFNDIVPARLDGGLGEQRSEQITFDGAGNISIAGIFDGTADFSGASMTGGNNSMFLASYNTAAVLRGAQAIVHSTTDGASTITSLSADQLGNVYLAGMLKTGSGNLDFGGMTLDDVGESDAYVVHYDINTELQVAARYGTNYISGEFSLGTERTFAIDVCPMDEVWMTGVAIAGTASFGPFALRPYGLEDGPDNSDAIDSYVVNIDFLNPPDVAPKMYWTEEQYNQINRANLDGTFFEQYYSGFSVFPQGISYDYVEDYIFWTDTNGKVRKGKIGPAAFIYYEDVIDEHTNNQRVNLGVALDLTAGKVYWVSEWDGSIKSAEYEAPIPISTLEIPITGLEAPSAVAIDPAAGKIYYSDTRFLSGTDYEASIHSASLDGSNDQVLYNEFRTNNIIKFHDIKLDVPAGKIYWSMTDTGAGGGMIYSASMSDIPSTVTSFVTPGRTSGIDIDQANGKIYWVDKEIISSQPPRLLRADLNGTNQEVLRETNAANLFKPNFIALGLAPLGPPPTAFKSIYPEIGHQGESVLITGTSFGAISEFVDFNGANVTDQESVNTHNLIVKVPSVPITSGPVHVDVTAGAVSSAQHFTPAFFSDGKASEWLQITGVPSIALAGTGDVDNDGVSDFVIGNYLAGGDDYGGTVVVTLNANKTVKGTSSYTSSIEGERFGASLSTVGDFNGDGVPDIASGAIGSDDGGSDHGKIYFQGASGNLLGSFSDASGVLAGALSDVDQFGFATALLGDMHANGVMDLAVSANRDAGGGTQRGAVYVLFLQNGGSVESYVKIGNGSGGFTEPLSNNDRFGSAVCNIGDIDGNGIPDLAVSAIGDDVGAGDAGAVYILLLNADGTVSSQRKITDETSGFTGDLDNADSFGFALSTAGDLDRDGIGDLLVGAPGDDDGGLNRGAVYVLMLNADGTVKQTQKLSTALGNSFEGILADNAQFGRSIALVGDPDHDGYRDFAIGATAPSSVWIVELGTNEIAGFNGPTAASPPILSGQTMPVDFSSASQGTDIDHILAFQNSGNAKLRITSINISGTAFSIVGAVPTEVLAGGLINLTIRLSGSTAGTFNESITIVNDDADEPNFNFPVTGQILNCGNPPTANAGPPQSICQGAPASLSGVVQFASTFAWSTSGNGTFNNNSILAPAYTPGPADIASGLVTLSLSTNDPDGSGPCAAASSQMSLTVNASGGVNAGADLITCPSSSLNLNGSVSGTVLNPVWTTSGNGVFGNSSALSTTYTPGSAEIASGTVTITLTGTGVGVCPSSNDALSVVVVRPPVAADLTVNASIGQVSLANVLAASTIPTGSTTQVTITQAGTKGSTTVKSDQQIEYNATNGTVGLDLIQYRICNQCSQCDDGLINIVVLNVAPAYAAQPSLEISIGSGATVELATHLFDLNNNLDLSTLAIVGSPLSQATATLDANFNLHVDYSTATFVGTDQITLRVCDLLGACLQFLVTIEVTGEIVVYNGISPNGDGPNDYWKIGNIQFIEPQNKVSLFNRWGDAIYEADNYNNTTIKFEGVGTNGKPVSSGTYFYKIEFSSGRAPLTGYLTVKN